MAERHIHNPGLSIVVLSLVVNFLVLPMYKRADAMQAEERDMEKKLEHWTKHIKSTFKGDERFMMLQTYYRQANYKQLYVLKSSIPLLLQVPFFMAAYNFLSHLDYIDGVKLGPIANLALPDGMFSIGSFSINVLPILMTLINIVAGAIYSKGLPIKTKIQMNGIAIVFLVLLYNSPAGLVFYWTLNNVFSLFKNIITKLSENIEIKKPTLPVHDLSNKADTLVFFLSSVLLTFYIGVVMPVEVLSRNPQEYVIIGSDFNPMVLVLYSVATAGGFFIVWLGVFYYLARKNTRGIYSLLVSVFLFTSVYNSLGVSYTGLSMSTMFYFTKPFHWTTMDNVINIFCILAIIGITFLIWKYKRQFIVYVILTVLLASGVMTIKNYAFIHKEIGNDYYSADNYVVPANITLSKNGHNVVVLMLDRAIGTYYPYIMDNNEELQQSFAGFTYYSHAYSYGQNTIFGEPAIMGGPDYSCEAINLRSDVSMKTKIDESLLVMPRVFTDNGFKVTVADPSYAGYHWIPDLSIYDDIEGVSAVIAKGSYSSTYENYDELCDVSAYRQQRNFFCYCMTRCMPIFTVDYLYDDGHYYAIEYNESPIDALMGFDKSFVDSYSTLTHLSDMTTILDDDSDNMLLMVNETTHSTGSRYNIDYSNGITDSNGNVLPFDNYVQEGAYETNILSYEAVAEWLDYLRAEGVYDNTRIIIVSDHGYYLNQIPELITDDNVDLMAIDALLLYKDFNDNESSVDNMFITNAAVPYLATNGIIDNPTNPYTGNVFSLDYLNNPQLVLISTNIMPQSNPRNVYVGGQWYVAHLDDEDRLVLEKTNTP